MFANPDFMLPFGPALTQLKKWVTNTKTYIRVVLTAILQGFGTL
jgi:hypothetical protein